jgi:hypothetical protein
MCGFNLHMLRFDSHAPLLTALLAATLTRRFSQAPCTYGVAAAAVGAGAAAVYVQHIQHDGAVSEHAAVPPNVYEELDLELHDGCCCDHAAASNGD